MTSRSLNTYCGVTQCMNIHYKTWIAQGRFTNMILTPSKQWGVCDNNISNIWREMPIVKQRMQHLTNNETENYIQMAFPCNDKETHRRCMYASKTLLDIRFSCCVPRYYLQWYQFIVSWARDNIRQWNFTQNDENPGETTFENATFICSDICPFCCPMTPNVFMHKPNLSSYVMYIVCTFIYTCR